MLIANLPLDSLKVLEIGSGDAEINEYYPHILTSDIFFSTKHALITDGHRLPFRQNILDGIIMVNVFHHLRDLSEFFTEASRVVRSGGRIIMIEPWLTTGSRLIYKYLHHEPCEPEMDVWESPSRSIEVNEALPWMVFYRDVYKFQSTYNNWHITKINPFMPILYIISGGRSIPQLLPDWNLPFLEYIEKLLQPYNHHFAMFALIVLTKI